MPTNYKEQITSGEITSWVRAKQIIIDNFYNQLPEIKFLEEKITNYPNGDVNFQNKGMLTESFDPNRMIPLINPETGAPLGTSVSLIDLQVILFSYYIDMAIKRDQGV